MYVCMYVRMYVRMYVVFSEVTLQSILELR